LIFPHPKVGLNIYLLGSHCEPTEPPWCHSAYSLGSPFQKNIDDFSLFIYLAWCFAVHLQNLLHFCHFLNQSFAK
jgi:hypothetical protein